MLCAGLRPILSEFNRVLTLPEFGRLEFIKSQQLSHYNNNNTKFVNEIDKEKFI